jgi:ATP-binding cassette subfamily C protein CydD
MVGAARGEVLSAAARAGPAMLGGESAGARTSQIVDRTGKLAAYAAGWLPGQQLALIGPLIVLIASATQTWLAAILLLVSVIVLPLFIWLTASETASRARAQQASLDLLSGSFQARAAQAGLIRAFRAVTRETRALELASESLRQRTMAILRVAFLSTAVLEFFASVSIALVAVYVGFKLLGVFPFETGETLTLAEGLTVLILAPEFFAPIRKLSGLHHDRADGVAAAEMLAPWIAAAEATEIRRLPRLNAAPVIAFEEVALAHAGQRAAVRGVSFTARPGELCALSGVSGSGKSSCLLALLARTRRVEGRILIDARPLEDGASLAESVAYVGQTPWVVEGTVRSNLLLGAPAASEAALEDAARQTGLLNLLTASGRTLDSPLGRFGAGLSGGQRQRLALARALLRDAPILLLDEPTAHLDPDAEAGFLAVLESLARGRTLLIASHSEAVLAACDLVVPLGEPAEMEPA